MEDFSELSELLKAAKQAAKKAHNTAGTLSDIFEEEPVDLTTFIQDAKYLNSPPLSDVQFDVVRHIERVYDDNTYARMSKEFGGYWTDNVPGKNLFTLQWGKGCLVSTEEIYDAQSGQWIPITELTGSRYVQGVPDVLGNGDTTHLPESPALGQSLITQISRTDGSSFKRGHGRCLKVTTTSGQTISVFEGHLFVSWESHNLPFKNRYKVAKPVWRQAANMQPGDRIAIVNKLDCLEPVAQDPVEVELTGYWLGDACMPTDNQGNLCFFIDSSPVADDLRNRYISLVESLPNIKARITVGDSGCHRIYSNGHVDSHPTCLIDDCERQRPLKRGLCNKHYLRAQNSGTLNQYPVTGNHYGKVYPVYDMIRKVGLWGCRAWNKRVPKQYFSLPDNQVRLLLSAMWDTDGSLYYKSGSPTFEYGTSSEGLAQDVQRLLYRLGIVSRIVTTKPKSYTYKGEKKFSSRVHYKVIISSGHYVEKLSQQLSLHGEKEIIRNKFLAHKWGRIQQVPEGNIYWDEIKSIEDIGDHDYWDITIPEMGTYVAGSGPILSSNSGKGYTVRIAFLRVAYLLLCLKSPLGYYGMAPNEFIHMINMAKTAAQARETFFRPLKSLAMNSWFKDHCEPTINLLRFDKNIVCISGNSEGESQEGLNPILSVTDEIDSFASAAAILASGKKPPLNTIERILEILESSGDSRFPKKYKSVRISYPRYLGSTIQKLTREGRDHIELKAKEGDNSSHYVSGPLATWEVNPVRSIEDFEDKYDRDPLSAAAMYECKPTFSMNTYFRNDDAIEEAFKGDPNPLVVAGYTRTGSSWEPEYIFSNKFIPIVGAEYAMHGDLAINGDRAGIAMAHVVKWEEYTRLVFNEAGDQIPLNELRPIIKVDFVITYEADISGDDPREIQIRWARELAYKLIGRGFNIRQFTFDRFQSSDSMQQLEERGITSKRVSTDINIKPWETLRDVMYDGRLIVPHSRELINELKGLGRLPNGKIDHSAHSGKDAADALACAVMGALELGGQESEEGNQAYYASAEFAVGNVSGGDTMPIGFDKSMLEWDGRSSYEW